MILVDLEVPALGRLYQFSVDETCGAGVLIAEMAEIICQKEHCGLPRDQGDFELFDKTGERLLNPAQSLAEQGVRNADVLLLL